LGEGRDLTVGQIELKISDGEIPTYQALPGKSGKSRPCS
jgi:hypothetical protein